MEWMPIESAPTDGSDVLLFTDSRLDTQWADMREAMGMDHFTAIQIGYWEEATNAPMRREPAGWRTQRIGAPTHWMPLPAPPAN